MEDERIVTRSKRTLRLTGRKRIPRDCVQLRLLLADDGRAEAFEGTMKLQNFGLPEDARVIVIAERGNDAERFECGRVGNGSITVERQDLGEFGYYGSGLRFRVLVVHPSTRQILASADKLRPSALVKEKPILQHVQRDIGKLAWRIEFGEEGPLLLLNRNLPRGAFASPQFVCFALPAVLREILDRAIRERALEGGDLENESEDWKSEWFKFAEELTGRKVPEGDPDDPQFQEECERWLDEVIQVFCEKKTDRAWKKLVGEYQL